MKLVELYKLENRVAKLERSVGRGGAPTNAKVLWQYLIDNGPSTADEIKMALPDKKYSGGPALNLFLSNNLITRQGTRYVANPDYEWDDVGKISLPTMPNIADVQASIGNGDIINVDNTPKTRRARAPKPVTPNIWSFKPEEVKAAIDAGVNVNSKDDKGRTPLFVATMSKRSEALQIVKLLLDNGANPNSEVNYMTVIVSAVSRDKLDAALLMANAKDYKPANYILKSVLSNDDKITDQNKYKSIVLALLNKIDDSEFDDIYTRGVISTLIRKFRLHPDVFNYLFNRFESYIKSGNGHIAKEFYNNIFNEIRFFGSFRILSQMVTNHMWPEGRLFYSDTVSNLTDKQSLTKLFNLIKSNYNDILKSIKHKHILRDDVITLGRYLNQDLSFTNDNTLSAESIKAMPRSEAIRLFERSIKSADLTTIKAVAESKRTDLIDNEIIIALCLLDDSYKQIILTAIKILSRSLKASGKSVDDMIVRSYAIGSVFRSSNKYVIEWLLDEDETAIVRKFYDRIADGNSTSETVRKVLAAHGATLNNRMTNRTIDRSRKSTPDKRKSALDKLGQLLKADGSNRSIQSWEDSYSDDIPNPWSDPEVIEIVYDPQYDDSVLATQLRREVSKPEPAKYDF